jgi:hypothetical protein
MREEGDFMGTQGCAGGKRATSVGYRWTGTKPINSIAQPLFAATRSRLMRPARRHRAHVQHAIADHHLVASNYE